MSMIWIKTLLAGLFLLVVLTAFLSMMSIMGRQEKKGDPQRLRRRHKAAGRFAVVLGLALAVMGFRFWSAVGDAAASRVVWHAVLGIGLLTVLLIKLLVVRIYKQFLRFAPALGILLFALAVIVFTVSGGYTIVRGLSAPQPAAAAGSAPPPEPTGDPAAGRAIFDGKCAACHFRDKRDVLFGPGFLGLLKADQFPSGRAATRENIVKQLRRPMVSMPAFPDFTEGELNDLIAYLSTL